MTWNEAHNKRMQTDASKADAADVRRYTAEVIFVSSTFILAFLVTCSFLKCVETWCIVPL